MRQFDPWPVFFKREWGRNWRSWRVCQEDAKNSPFVQKHRS
ncbi:unnamed protein product [Spirodela intermedia]|uniref:Uncharacterized protein n=1 Tax=Spirodela intermedia TaxID=51605 RepID=A0A7I8IXN2_SPIIN|nr:unnamed protein product [Spirodela intermedia]CAA6661760.1 unnamed protein product [Spirodela intermedia]